MEWKAVRKQMEKHWVSEVSHSSRHQRATLQSKVSENRHEVQTLYLVFKDMILFFLLIWKYLTDKRCSINMSSLSNLHVPNQTAGIHGGITPLIYYLIPSIDFGLWGRPILTSSFVTPGAVSQAEIIVECNSQIGLNSTRFRLDEHECVPVKIHILRKMQF